MDLINSDLVMMINSNAAVGLGENYVTHVIYEWNCDRIIVQYDMFFTEQFWRIRTDSLRLYERVGSLQKSFYFEERKCRNDNWVHN